VLDNRGIEDTLKLFQAMERDAGPRDKLNWRFQQALYRAYYDAFVRVRLQHEIAAADSARAKLLEAKQVGSLAALKTHLRASDYTITPEDPSPRKELHAGAGGREA